MFESVIPSIFPAEWHLQSAVHIVWPSVNSDWHANYEEVTTCYSNIARAILGSQKLIIVFPEDYPITDYFSEKELNDLIVVFEQYNDTWVRDYGGISVLKGGEMHLLDFKFNAWGDKFSWELDNQQTRNLIEKGMFSKQVRYNDQLNFVLEGGAIDSNGVGLLLTTKSCLLNPNRNPGLSQKDIEKKLCETLNVQEVLWLNRGSIIGDDTDGHVDTLARFVKEDSLVYVKCDNSTDPHFRELQLMEIELKELCQRHNLKMIPLPLPKPIFNAKTGKQLPATYANFLILNKLVLLPTYDCPQDIIAVQTLKSCFPEREIISINCVALIQQGGSLHCATMQYPSAFVN